MRLPARARAVSDEVAAAALEIFLARLYTDAGARARFLADPVGVARGAGLSEDELRSVVAIDRGALEAAAHSFAHKRARHAPAAEGE